MPVSVPPSPDTTHVPHHQYEVLECLYLTGDRHRAVLLRNDSGLFRISYDSWPNIAPASANAGTRKSLAPAVQKNIKGVVRIRVSATDIRGRPIVSALREGLVAYWCFGLLTGFSVSVRDSSS